MSKLRTWLAEPWPAVDYDPFGEDPLVKPLLSSPPTRLEYVAAFMAMDRGGYGIHMGGGVYGWVGLTQDQAHVWWSMKAFIMGILYAIDADGSEQRWLNEAVAREHERVKALLAAIRSAVTEVPPAEPT